MSDIHFFTTLLFTFQFRIVEATFRYWHFVLDEFSYVLKEVCPLITFGVPFRSSVSTIYSPTPAQTSGILTFNFYDNSSFFTILFLKKLNTTWNYSVCTQLRSYVYYVHSRKVFLTPHARTRLTDRQTDGWADRQYICGFIKF